MELAPSMRYGAAVKVIHKSSNATDTCSCSVLQNCAAAEINRGKKGTVSLRLSVAVLQAMLCYWLHSLDAVAAPGSESRQKRASRDIAASNTLRSLERSVRVFRANLGSFDMARGGKTTTKSQREGTTSSKGAL